MEGWGTEEGRHKEAKVLIRLSRVGYIQAQVQQYGYENTSRTRVGERRGDGVDGGDE